MKRTLLLLSTILGVVLFTSCENETVAPNYQSTFVITNTLADSVTVIIGGDGCTTGGWETFGPSEIKTITDECPTNVETTGTFIIGTYTGQIYTAEEYSYTRGTTLNVDLTIGN